MGVLPLIKEKQNVRGIESEEAQCTLCNNIVDETHFLCTCFLYIQFFVYTCILNFCEPFIYALSFKVVFCKRLNIKAI